MRSFFPLLSAICLLLPILAHAQSAAAWIVTDATSGYVLDSANAAKKRPIASLTKIATGMVVLDWADAQKGK